MADDLLSYYQAPDEASAQKQAAIIAEAIRKKRENAAQQQAMGAILGLSGTDNGAGRLGQSFSKAGAQDEADADQTATQLAAAPQHRLAMAMNLLQQKKLQADTQAAEQRRAAMADSGSVASRMRFQLAKTLGMDVPDNAPGNAIDDKELDVAERIRAAQLAAQAARARMDVTHSDKTDQLNTKREDALLKELGDKLDRFKVRGGLKGYSDTMARVNQIKGQVLDPATGQIKADIDPRQMAELAITLQQAVANGHPSEKEAEMLLPKGIGSDVAKLVEYYTGRPYGTNQNAIAEKMLHSAENAAHISKQAIMDAYKENMSGPLSGLYGIGTESAKRRAQTLIKQHHINPEAIDETGGVIEDAPFELTPPAQQPKSAALSPEDKKAIDWANAHLSDPRAAGILKLHGMGK